MNSQVLVLFYFPGMKYHLEDGIMNMAAFLRGFEERGIKTDRPEDQLSKEKKKILFSFCEVCNIQLNSAAQAQVHYNGKSHRKRVKQLSDGQPPLPAQSSGPLLASSSTNTSTGRKEGLGAPFASGTNGFVTENEGYGVRYLPIKTTTTMYICPFPHRQNPGAVCLLSAYFFLFPSLSTPHRVSILDCRLPVSP